LILQDSTVFLSRIQSSNKSSDNKPLSITGSMKIVVGVLEMNNVPITGFKTFVFP
jgi:hypothetical protein